MPGFIDRLFGRRPADLSMPAEVEPVRSSVSAGDASARLRDAARGFVRTTYVPNTENTAFGADSGFGGLPYLPAGVDHPGCPNCHQPMPLLVQLAIDTLPPDVRPPGDGLIQAFYCDGAPADDPDSACDVELEGWRPFSKASSVRLVDVGTGAPSAVGRSHPPRHVTAWEPAGDDIPSWQEAEELGIEYPDDLADEDDLEVARTGDKLGGWPAWVQGVEYPDCPQCGAQMALVLQIESEEHVPVMFGDLGTGHVTQCRAHPEVLAFGWACS
jgi:hypothetical protein